MKKLWEINIGDLVKKVEEAQIPIDASGIDLSKTEVKMFYDDERKSLKMLADMTFLTDEHYNESMDALKEAPLYLDEVLIKLITDFSEEPESEQ